MKSILLASVFVLATSTGAALAAAALLPPGLSTVPLAVVTNDGDSSVSRLELMLDEQASVRGIYMETRAGADGAPSAEGRAYPLAQIETGNGVVLGQGQGVKAIFLRGTIASGDGEGSLVIRYLTNGVFRHYAECRIDLEKLGPDRWQLVNAYDGRSIQRIKVRTWALGISTVANVCPGTTLG